MESTRTHSVDNVRLEGFQKSLDELLTFADSFKLREREIEQNYQLKLEKQKAEFEIQIDLEKKRFEQLQEINRSLQEKLTKALQKEIELDQKYTALSKRHQYFNEMLQKLKQENEEKSRKIENFEENLSQLTKDKSILQEKLEHVQLEYAKYKSSQTTSAATIPDELIPLVEEAVAENKALKSLLSERDEEIQRLNEKLHSERNEDPQVIEQRLLQMMNKLKNDFRLMYENQSNFFLEKIDLLKQEQRDNIASLYKHS